MLWFFDKEALPSMLAGFDIDVFSDRVVHLPGLRRRPCKDAGSREPACLLVARSGAVHSGGLVAIGAGSSCADLTANGG